MKNFRKLACLTALVATGSFFLTGFHDLPVLANNTPQTLPFSQNWATTTLITANDDWSGVPGIVGFLGDYTASSPTGVDPRSLVTPFTTNAIDVIANQANASSITGGVAEIDGITNPVVALQGSGTADAPHLVVHLNTTGSNNVCFSYSARDVDDTADNAVSPIATQYRVGSSGDWINVPGGFIADASTGPSQATLVTPVNVVLPAAARNQPEVQVRIITTNSPGNDEWIGIDDISATSCATPARSTAPVDFNGDGRTDFAVARNTAGQLRWYWSLNGGGGIGQMDWGLVGDTLVMEDFDGDGKDDITAWRQATGTASAFYIFQSQTSTARIEQFGIIGDDATVVGDYDGDGKADLSVYRAGANPGNPSTWFYKGSLNNPSGNITYVLWGMNGDRVGPGDYDGDGKFDFVVKRDSGGSGVWWQRLSGGATVVQHFGLASDRIVPGDYDGDGKTDLTALRSEIGPMLWFYLPSSGGPYQEISWGNSSDFAVQGDYDGDGKTDVAVWKATNPGQFLSRNSSNGGYLSVLWGSSNDFAIAFFNRH